MPMRNISLIKYIFQKNWSSIAELTKDNNQLQKIALKKYSVGNELYR